MKLTYVEILLDCLIGSMILFVISMLFSGAVFASPSELMAAYAVCFIIVFLAESVFCLRHMIHDHGYEEADENE